MTKTEQNRVIAWRLKVLREASATPRNVAPEEGPIRSSWRCWTVRSATSSAPFPAGHSA
jgi:hypothetical protein